MRSLRPGSCPQPFALELLTFRALCGFVLVWLRACLLPPLAFMAAPPSHVQVAIPVAIVDAADPIVQLLSVVASDGQGHIAAADRLQQLLRGKRLLYDAVIAPRSLGFDPCNRDGQGGNPLNVLALAAEIALVGYSASEVKGAICAEALPGDRSIEKFNEKLSTGSGMAPVEENSITYGSLGCGHLNYVLRCVAAGVPSDCPYLSENGHMSVDKLRRRDPEFAEKVASGLKWQVVKWQVRYLYPTALHFIQAARNLSSQMYRVENEMQGLLRLHSYSAAAQKVNKDIPWQTIKTTLLRTRPVWAESFEDMMAFVASRSGGVEGRFLLYLAAFHRNHVDSTRTTLPSALYRALADFPSHYVALALFQAAWRCPKESVTNGRCLGISASEVNALAKSQDEKVKDKLKEASDVLASCRVLLPKAGVNDDWDTTKLCKILARLDILMARYLLDKQEQSKQKFATAKEIGLQFLADLRREYPEADLQPFGASFVEALPPPVP